MNLEKWLKENRWTKAAFAKELNTSQDTVRRWCKKEQRPHLFMREAIKKFTNGEVNYDRVEQ